VPEYRRILLDGAAVEVRRDGGFLVAADGRRVSAADAVHLPPVTPTKIVAVHLNHLSRVREFGATLPPAPSYFHKPVSALVAHGGAVVSTALGGDWEFRGIRPPIRGHRQDLGDFPAYRADNFPRSL
jgi:2-keto-4-pentenoate hydratase/2-oxohepta-3-ene-1,7-dioic acid hydratase in catechol pathway